MHSSLKSATSKNAAPMQCRGYFFSKVVSPNRHPQSSSSPPLQLQASRRAAKPALRTLLASHGLIQRELSPPPAACALQDHARLVTFEDVRDEHAARIPQRAYGRGHDPALSPPAVVQTPPYQHCERGAPADARNRSPIDRSGQDLSISLEIVARCQCGDAAHRKSTLVHLIQRC